MFNALAVLGDKLAVHYRRAFIDMLDRISTPAEGAEEWLTKYKDYSQNRLRNEFWNQAQYIEGDIDDEALGLDLVRQFNKRLKEKCEKLREKAADPNYTGEGVFKNNQY